VLPEVKAKEAEERRRAEEEREKLQELLKVRQPGHEACTRHEVPDLPECVLAMQAALAGE
jgi:hypothetical protein